MPRKIPRTKIPKQPLILYRPDKATQLLLLQTYEKLQVIFLRLSNLQVEVQELRATVAKSNTLFLTLLNDPETHAHALAVAKDLGVGAGTTVKNSPK